MLKSRVLIAILSLVSLSLTSCNRIENNSYVRVKGTIQFPMDSDATEASICARASGTYVAITLEGKKLKPKYFITECKKIVLTKLENVKPTTYGYNTDLRLYSKQENVKELEIISAKLSLTKTRGNMEFPSPPSPELSISKNKLVKLNETNSADPDISVYGIVTAEQVTL